MPDAYLFDTNIATAVWDKGNPDHLTARAYQLSLGASVTVLVSVVTLAEVEYGLRIAPRIDASRQSDVRSAMSSYPLVMPITRHTIEFYSEIRSKLFVDYSPKDARGRLTAHWVEDLVDRTTGKALGAQENDIWIAAQALEMNVALVTDDKMDHMSRLVLDPPLRTIRWK